MSNWAARRDAFLSATCVAAVVAGLLPAARAAAQVAIPQGPAPITGSLEAIQSGDVSGVTGTVTGTVTGIVPIDANTLYVGTVNGGVWKTTNGGTNWTPLTDNQASLSIASLTLDPTDSARRTLVAGIGQWSTGAVSANFRGGLQTGLLYSQTGGASWQPLNNGFKDQTVADAIARDQIIMAATFNTNDVASPTGGLYRSGDRGANFKPVQLLPAQVPVTSLVGDPSTTSTMYAATTSPTKKPDEVGIFRSLDNGANWVPIFTKDTLIPGNVITTNSNQLVGRIATGPGGALAVGFMQVTFDAQNNPQSQVVALYLSKDRGQTWTALALPNPPEGGGINPGKQALSNFAVAIDPKNANIVYVAGDRQQGTGASSNEFPNSIGAQTFTVSAWRVQLNADGRSITTPITDNFAASQSTVHSDSRSIAFDSAGNLLLSTDAGLYLRTQPQSSSGGWRGLNGNISLFQTYVIAYDANSKRLVVAGQDAGAAIQGNPGQSANYTGVRAGDGLVAAVNDKLANNRSAIYTSWQGLGFGLTTEDPTVGSSGVRRDILTANGSYIAPPTFFTLSGLQKGDVQNGQLPFASTFITNKVDPTRIAIGTNFVYTTVDTTVNDPLPPATADLSLTVVDRPPKAPVKAITALAYGVPGDPSVSGSQNVNALLAADGGGLYLRTTASGTLDKTKYAGGEANSVVFDTRTVDRFYVADGATVWSTNDRGQTPFKDISPTKDVKTFIRPLSVEFITRNGVNALLAGGLSNVADAPSPIVVADSKASGDLSSWRSFGSNLPNTMVSALFYNPSVDVLAIGTFGRGAFLMYDVTSYFKQAMVLQFGLADNDSAPNASILTDGIDLNNNSFVRPLQKDGTGTLTIAGVASYTGLTTVNGGTLLVNGSLTSSAGVTVNSNGVLAGIGTVSSTTINSGGTLAPGSGGVGTLTVAGNLLFNPQSFYQINVVGSVVTNQASVSATATLAGTVQARFQPSDFTRTYTILTAGGLTGVFDAVAVEPVSVRGTLGYTATGVTANFSSAMGQISGLGANQAGVGGALDNVANTTGGLQGGLEALYSLSAGQLATALAELSGQSHASEHTVLINQALYSRQTILARLRQAPYAGNAGPEAALAYAGPDALSIDDGTDPGDPLAYAGQKKSAALPAFPIKAPASDYVPTRGLTFWAQGLGGWGKVNGNGNAEGVNGTFAGVLSGADVRLADNWLVGMALGYSQSNTRVNALASSALVDTGLVAGYAGTNIGAWNLRLGGTYAINSVDTSRSIVFPGFMDRATARYNAGTGQMFGEIGYGTAIRSVALEPFAGLAWVHLNTADFTESGGAAALTARRSAEDTGYTSLGIRAATAYPLANGMMLVPRGSVAWQYAFGELNPGAAIAFATIPGTNFGVTGVPIARNSALIDAGADLRISPQAKIGLYYTGQHANTAHENALRGNVTWYF